MKIVVLAGGLSPERDVSLSSGSLVANSLRKSGHRVLLLDVYEGLSANECDFDSLFKDDSGTPYSYKVPEVKPDLDEIKRRSNNGEALIGPNVLEICKLADIVFVALHGAMGENGQLQATFDVMGIKYTGTGYIGCLLAMDKDISKQIMYHSGIKTAEWLTFNANMINEKYIINQIGIPCVVKPCSNGSSIGVSIVNSIDELPKALISAKNAGNRILVEKKITGREFSVGIVNNKALPVIEIIPKSGFYDYKNKYQTGGALEVCPAALSESETLKVQNMALKTHEALQLGSYSRMDFILSEDGEFYCLEANTLPGMTPTSLIPQEASVAGIQYDELCNLIIESAVK